jgi:N-acetylmuramoyl-L-alanine amidase
VLVLTAGKRTALWNGMNMELGFAPAMTNGQPCLHQLDLAKTLAPLTLRPALLLQSNRVVMLDPGHGGDNRGAKSAVADHYEKEFALDWAFRLERLLKAAGWTVYLTRTTDVDVPLADRVGFADAVHADLFISLHFNSTDQPQSRTEQGGIETYCLTPVGMQSSVTRHFEDEPGRAYPNNSFDDQNYLYASRLHRAIVAATQRRDRGLRRARFMGVLRGQNRPAVLVEGGYLTHPAEARLIGNPDYRQKLAEAVAAALAE